MSILFFVKHEIEGKILIVSLYVDDLIYAINDLQMMDDFKQSFMTDLGRMRYFLGIEIKHDNDGIFIHKQKYRKFYQDLRWNDAIKYAFLLFQVAN